MDSTQYGWIPGKERSLRPSVLKGKKNQNWPKASSGKISFVKIMNIFFNKINFPHKFMRFCAWSLCIIYCVEWSFWRDYLASKWWKKLQLGVCQTKKASWVPLNRLIVCGYLFSWGWRSSIFYTVSTKNSKENPKTN